MILSKHIYVKYEPLIFGWGPKIDFQSNNQNLFDIMDMYSASIMYVFVVSLIVAFI